MNIWKLLNLLLNTSQKNLQKNGFKIRKFHFKHVKIYLLGHALELGLKSFLSYKGKSINELINVYEHNLIKCFNDAQKLGLKLPGFTKVEIVTTKSRIQAFTLAYKSQSYRYFKKSKYNHPIPFYFVGTIKKILQDIKKQVT